jgi:serine O-acetyltransferase
MSTEIGLLRTLREDLETVVERDPSIHNRWDAVWHLALAALWTHRVTHRLHRSGLRTPARLIAYFARGHTGVEIHPGAVLGRRVFIDHGAAVVIGETAVVGDDVTIFQQVTLGAVGWWSDNKRAPGERRHPVIGDGVVLGANATVLGPVTVGDHALIGAMATVTKDIAAGARVYAPPSVVRLPTGTAEVVCGPHGATAHDPVRVLASAGSW